MWKSKFYGAFVLNHPVVLHAIDATPARWRGDAVSSPLDRARTAASSPRNDLVKNCRVHPTHWLISTQVTRLALDLVLDSIDATCKQLAGLSPLKDLSPMRHAAECSAPALFMQARSDRIIALKHVEALANRYGGSRKLAIVDGTHSSPRNGAARQFVARYLKKHVRLPEDAVVADGAARDRALELAPWHRARAALPPA